MSDIQQHVRPGGRAIINVLIEGTTYLAIFEPVQYYLFGHGELQNSFTGWEILESRCHNFEAPGKTVKLFATVVAMKPGS